MPILYIPVGIPGCGKTTLANALPHAVYVSSDGIREELGDVYDQTQNEQVFAMFHASILDALEAGLDVFADATSLNRFARENLRTVVDSVNIVHPEPEFWVTTHVFLFRNLEQAIRRNSQRERVVPGDAMLRMIEKYEQTIQSIYDEGWDHITEISKVS